MLHPAATTGLRVLIANERADRLALLAVVVEGMGHEIVAQEIGVDEVGAVTARLRPDLALVGLGQSREHAHDLISEIVRESFCPVIALIPSYDATWIEEAARRGIFAYIVDARPDEIQSAIEIALGRFLEHARLPGRVRAARADDEASSRTCAARQQLLLEVQDGILQQLTIASLGLQLGEVTEPLVAITNAVAQAKTIVSETIRELLEVGTPLTDVLRDSVAQSDE